MLLVELKRVLAYPKIRAKVGAAEAEAVLALLNDGATIVDDPVLTSSPRSADPHDDYLIALAQVARAIIVSGDHHLLEMADQIPVYAPADLQIHLRSLRSE